MDASPETSPGASRSERFERVPPELLARPVHGVRLAPGTLGDQLGEGVTLLVFLRHFGCIFCREMVGDLRAAAERDPDYPDVLIFFQGSATEGRAFLRRDWPEARAVADPDLELYDAFGVRRGNLFEALGPRVLLAERRARRKGHRNGPRSGDPWRLPGLFAVQGDRVLWSHRPRNAADHPDFERLPAMIAASRA